MYNAGTILNVYLKNGLETSYEIIFNTNQTVKPFDNAVDFSYLGVSLPLGFYNNARMILLDESDLEADLIFEPQLDKNNEKIRQRDFNLGSIVKFRKKEWVIVGKDNNYFSEENKKYYSLVPFPKGSDNAIEVEESKIDEILTDGYEIKQLHFAPTEIKNVSKRAIRSVRLLPLGSKIILRLSGVVRYAHIIGRYLKVNNEEFDYCVKFMDDENIYYCNQENILDVLSLGYTDIKDYNYIFKESYIRGKIK